MKGLVNRMAEGSLDGLLLRYTEYHVRHCRKCEHAVTGLEKLLCRLRGIKPVAKPLDESRWTEIEASWDKAEADALS